MPSPFATHNWDVIINPAAVLPLSEEPWWHCNLLMAAQIALHREGGDVRRPSAPPPSNTVNCWFPANPGIYYFYLSLCVVCVRVRAPSLARDRAQRVTDSSRGRRPISVPDGVSPVFYWLTGVWERMWRRFHTNKEPAAAIKARGVMPLVSQHSTAVSQSRAAVVAALQLQNLERRSPVTAATCSCLAERRSRASCISAPCTGLRGAKVPRLSPSILVRGQQTHEKAGT